MRVVWKDSITYKEYKYRKHMIRKHSGGWIADIPGDVNIYFSIDCAMNAIDKTIGGKLRPGAEKRQVKGIRIIGRNE